MAYVPGVAAKTDPGGQFISSPKRHHGSSYMMQTAYDLANFMTSASEKPVSCS